MLKFLFLISFLLPLFTSAGVIEVGKLYRNESSSIVSDSSGYEWKMWDYDSVYNHQELTYLFTDIDSDFYGWRFAGIEDMLTLYTSSGLNFSYFTSPCYDNNLSTNCETNHRTNRANSINSESNILRTLFYGDSIPYESQYKVYFEIDISDVNDYSRSAWYVGSSLLASNYVDIDMQGGGSFSQSDAKTTQINGYRYALVREVHEPSSYIILILGLFLLSYSRFKSHK
ncbi:hypothetical protein [Colwellia sp. BRX10-4]|uniref:hypothetical protein n=1 Tax=Colwellia sp. BRX10-4 TaxID=2759843 RepID=UPI0015F75324|nr:hypothetical protein [Colwellia sp. BRX10-4]MBA6398245.1 hypothetical protein [Colwellia sp. BRX10-4]